MLDDKRDRYEDLKEQAEKRKEKLEATVKKVMEYPPVLNAWLFNNGYHTVHHWKPTEHWSKLPELHASVSHLIHPELQLPQVFVYLFRTYAVGLFIGPKIPDFTGHPGSEERLPKAPPVPRSWSEEQVRTLQAA